jgi:magnesium transporter
MKFWALESKGDRVLEVPADELQDRLAHAAGILWIHVDVERGSDIPPALQEAAAACPLTLHAFHYDHAYPGVEQSRTALGFVISIPGRERPTQFLTLGIVLKDKVLMTFTHEPSALVEELRRAWMDDPEDLGQETPLLLHSLLDAAIDEFYPALDDVHGRAEDLEESLYQVDELDPTAPLSLKRELMALRKRISPLRDNLNSLIRFGAPLIPTTVHSQFNDLLNHCLRVAENADLGRDIVTSIMDAQLGLVSNRLNDVMRTLTVISTLLMVCGLVAGIYGMNFATMPELHWTYGYPFALGTMVVLCLIILWLFRRRRWI